WDDLAALLERQGARVVLAPALRIVPLEDDVELRATTMSLVERPPDIVVACTGIGLRGWIEAAEGWGLADRLRAALDAAYVIARGPKTSGALRTAGLAETWSPASEQCKAVQQHLLERRVAGQRVAVQLYGEPQPEFCAALAGAGAEVVEVSVYRWLPPPDPT